MRLLIFNPENDLALASNDPHYTPPASARQMAADLQDLPQLWAKEGDGVVRLTIGGTSSGPSPSSSPVREGRKVTADGTQSPLPNRGGAGGGAAACSTWGESSILPWGWSPLLVRQLRERGVPDSLLPTDEQMAEYRNFASRETAVRLLERLRTQWPEPFHSGALVGESAWCTSEVEVRCAIADYDGEAMLKAPWSGSGRGVHPVHGLPLSEQTQRWVRRTLQTQGGVEVEPYYDKVQDLAMEFWAEGGRVRYEGLSLFDTTSGGVYAGNLVATERKKEARLAAYIPLALLDEVKQRLTNLLNEAGLPAWYTGPLGVDMMVVGLATQTAPPPTPPLLGRGEKLPLPIRSHPSLTGEGSGEGPFGSPGQLGPLVPFSLHPLIELNLRMTMGWVALQLTSRLRDGETGTFCIAQQGGRYQALFSQNTDEDHKKVE